MAVTPALVKELREKTGVGMMDCKNALSESDGDIEKAIELLRKKGLSKAAKKAGRITAEGMVMCLSEGRRAAILEVNSETDFVAKNDDFKAFVENLARLVLENDPSDMEALMKLTYPGKGHSVTEELTNRVATIGENMNIRKFNRIEVPSGMVASYMHMGGKIGVIVGFEVENESALTNDEFKTLASDVAMHVCASEPKWVEKANVPPAAVEKEKEILVAQMKADPSNAKKPENILQKIVEGRIGKFYQDYCLNDQPFVKDDKLSISQLISQKANTLGTKIRITGFERFRLGDGIEKETCDFAKEVAETFK